MNTFISFLSDHYLLSIIVSILLNIVISIIGVIPSAFLTTINISLFGFKGSIIIGFIGESIGAAISFWLYRKGLIKLESKNKIPKFVKFYQVKNNLRSFLFILLLRILPFVPSSIVTLIAAIGSINFINFILASSIGKIPSLVFEVYSINTALKIVNLPIFILACIVSILLLHFIKKKNK